MTSVPASPSKDTRNTKRHKKPNTLPRDKAINRSDSDTVQILELSDTEVITIITILKALMKKVNGMMN